MPPAVSLITLAVRDLEASLAFYAAGFGWNPDVRMDDVAFFRLAGTALALWKRERLVEDALLASDHGEASFPGMTLARNCRNPEEVDAAFERAIQAGAERVKSPRKAFWGGYSGYLADPDGHVWEIAHNPFWTIGPDGTVLSFDAPK